MKETKFVFFDGMILEVPSMDQKVTVPLRLTAQKNAVLYVHVAHVPVDMVRIKVDKGVAVYAVQGLPTQRPKSQSCRSPAS